MTETVPITLHLSAEKAALLSEIAQQKDFSRDHLMEQAIDTYLIRRREWIEGIDEAIREVEAGNYIDAEELFAELENESLVTSH